MHAPSFAKIFSLYCSLQYGVVLQDWIEQNHITDYNIDVRYAGLDVERNMNIEEHGAYPTTVPHF